MNFTFPAQSSLSTYPGYQNSGLVPQQTPILTNNLFTPPKPKYSNAHKIIDNIWLGDIKSSQDEKFLRQNNIRVVINCSKNLPNTFKPFYIDQTQAHLYKQNNPFLEYARVEIDDNDNNKNQEILYNQLPNIISFIDQKLHTEKKPILIHSKKGEQRAATVIAAYMFYKFHPTSKCTMQNVIDYMKKERNTVFGYGYKFNFKKTLDQFILRYTQQAASTSTPSTFPHPTTIPPTVTHPAPTTTYPAPPVTHTTPSILTQPTTQQNPFQMFAYLKL